MEDNVLKALGEALPGLLGGLITAVIGFLGGVVGAVATPWARWGVEKRRRRQDRRRELIRAVREAVDQEEFGSGADFMRTADYFAIRPHLKKEILELLEGGDPIDPETGMVVDERRRLLEEMSRLEREWKLI